MFDGLYRSASRGVETIQLDIYIYMSLLGLDTYIFMGTRALIPENGSLTR